MATTIEWQGTIDNLHYDEDAVRAAGIDPTRWPARVERTDGGEVRLVIAADGRDDFTDAVRPTSCREADPEIPDTLAAELIAEGELDE